MTNESERIALEMSMHALDTEISKITDLIDEIDEVDRLYLNELGTRLNTLRNNVEKRSRNRLAIRSA